MFESMRRVFGPAVVAVIIGAIALVFVFYGVYNPRSTKGMGEGSLAATVNGDAISMQEFGREYQQRVEFYQNMMKGKADPNLLKQLGLRQQVLEELVRRRLMTQEAYRLGMTVSDEEVREKIKEMPYFKKDGKFDPAHYESVLAANRYSPATFEESIREDLLRNRLVEFMRSRARISDTELQKEFMLSENRRQVDYVVVTRESAKNVMLVPEKEVDEFLKSEQGLAAAKAHYEQNKHDYIKEMPKPIKGKDAKDLKEMPKPEYFAFEEVKRKVVTDMLKDRRQEDISKITKEMANELFAKAKSDAKSLKAAAKSKGFELKTTEKFNRVTGFVPGIGEVTDLIDDAFNDNSPLKQAPKMYESRGNFVIAMNLQASQPDMANFAKEKDRMLQQATGRKEQALYEQWMTDLRSKAKVSLNKSVTSGEEAEL